MKTTEIKKIEIDATDKTLGRVASECAKILMGKTSVEYTANKIPSIKVTIINASKTKATPERINQTIHKRYSGSPGGLKLLTNSKILEKHGWKKLYELAIYGMLPANKLRQNIMKNLTVKD
jgi:large subunit ribosomal protein L13